MPTIFFRTFSFNSICCKQKTYKIKINKQWQYIIIYKNDKTGGCHAKVLQGISLIWLNIDFDG